MGVRGLLVESPGSVAERLRGRRWQVMDRLVGPLTERTVLDLGGTVEFWLRGPDRPARVTVVNLSPYEGEVPDGFEAVTADACHFEPGEGYDLVVSNSLLEHVGGHGARRALAGVIRSAAPRFWVQTPYRYFPLEPHWLFPGMQFLPVALRASIARRWPLAHSRARDRAAAVESVLWTELIGRAEMRSLFPDATIRFERIGGIPKSLIAVRT